MNKEEIKAILSNFSAKCGAQLKYYLLKSMFPKMSIIEIREMGNFNANTFRSIRDAVEGKNLPLLEFETANSCNHECNCAENMQKLEDQILDLQKQAQMELDSYIAKEQEWKKQIQELEKEVLELRVKADYYKAKAEKPIVNSTAMDLF